ncbi:polyadenylate-binding protein [Fimicolochytrium jonesii]|uniref:polyadenylate-binding protein n=1 Tax=Fimicolochytrium jonesii TaxID=1396493 RepID=UPI0022FDB529|nr:polyadenylate-binding protein [Fimicolochytrium jonesii]KAI8826132.1 polyadenylate-binding protein [Fimicolochytrium jonesii]
MAATAAPEKVSLAIPTETQIPAQRVAPTKAADVTAAAAAAEPGTANAFPQPASLAQLPNGAAPSDLERPTPATASLYVGDLDASVTEAQLFEAFNAIGPVTSIRVCRDAVTRRSLGYAYVNFHEVADAERALEALNYAPIKDRPMRLMWSQRDPASRRSGAGNIFISNLDPLIDTRALHEVFTTFGPILSCKVAMDGEKSRGYGFVHFEESESADEAIRNLNGMLLNERKVFVGYHIPKKERLNRLEEQRAKFTNLYVKGLTDSITDEEFEQLFAKFGKITSSSVAREPDGKGRGFGFVNFSTHEEASAAVEEMHEKEVNGQQLYVNRAQKKFEREEELRRKFDRAREERMIKYQGVNLYVKNLDDSIDDEGLRQLFAECGTITSTKVMRDEKTGAPRGFGFVCFSSPEEATKAVTEMNARIVCSKPIYVALAQRKEVRRQHIDAQMLQRTQMRMQQTMGMGGTYPGSFYPPHGMVHPSRAGVVYPPPPMASRRWAGPGSEGPAQPGQAQIPVGAYAAVQPGPLPVQFAPQIGARPRQQQQRGPPGTRPNLMTSQSFQYTRQAYPNGVPQGQPGMAYMQPGRGPRTGPYRYNGPHPRNGPVSAQSTPNGAAPAKTPLTSAVLAEMSPDQQKRTLGENLFPLINDMTVHAGKVTGMLLEMDQSELLHLLEDTTALKVKVDEAVAVLEQHQHKPEEGVEAGEK